MSQEAVNSYDLVPYESQPFSHSHPSRLATIGMLFGMRPHPVHRCRVLELGCASGGNLIPMAVQLPNSQFLGVDLSRRQIDQGRTLVSSLGLRNIELRHANIQEIGEGDGTFDYLLSHGVFSWVPTEVQEAMFRIAAKSLHPQGVAYISYNTYPGWHLRGLIREMMRYHAANYATATLKTRHARGLLDFLAGSVPQDGSAYTALLRQEIDILRHHADYYLFHEHLEEINSPMFFHAFIERAMGHGLKYVGEANVRSMLASNLPEGVEKALRVMATDQIQLEQYMDFLRNRTFRETLLCHASTPLNRALDGGAIRRLWLSSQAEAVAEPASLQTEDPVLFRSGGGFSLTTTIPLMKAAFAVMRGIWPQAISFPDLVAGVGRRLRGAGPEGTLSEEDQSLLASRLMQAYLSSDLLDLHAGPFAFATQAGERPEACGYARAQAEHESRVTNRRHEVISLNPMEQALLCLLDGTKSRKELFAALAKSCEQERLASRRSEETNKSPEEEDQMLAEAMEAGLKSLTGSALLVG